MSDNVTTLINLAQHNKKFQKKLIKLSFKNLPEDEMNKEIVRLAKECGIELKQEELNRKFDNPFFGKKLDLSQLKD